MMWKNSLRVIGAVAALLAGGVHLKLYFDGYRDGAGNIGLQFVFNAVGAFAIALGLLAPLVSSRLPGWIPNWAASGGIAWAVISLIAFVIARTDIGWFGFTDETALADTTEAKLTVFPEILVLVAATMLRAVPLFGNGDGNGDPEPAESA